MQATVVVMLFLPLLLGPRNNTKAHVHKRFFVKMSTTVTVPAHIYLNGLLALATLGDAIQTQKMPKVANASKVCVSML
jgi:hypothetical protein